ncbi:MAG: TonB-dependent receptor [Ferruginibacter sp.]|nr:TonB-dependent receptor [Ferruginibacter sp.]
MKKRFPYLCTLVFINLFTISAFAQNNTVSGKVQDFTSKDAVTAVSVTVKGASAGTFTDDKGNFKITITQAFPVTLVISSVGYQLQEVTVADAATPVLIAFKPTNALGQEVVVSATKVATRILESPVSIERVSAAAIRNAPAASYYDVVGTLKGVDVVTASLTFKTPTTRGFAGSGNTRFTQLVDGMDNQAPGLNFSVGSVIGLTQLDVDNMELLPGASSALYGPGGMNGTLLINSKNPFKYQGLSFEVKESIKHVDGKEQDPSFYHNWNVRWAKKVSEKLAFKITTELVQAKDWVGDDYRNYKGLAVAGSPSFGTRASDPNYNGINVYGDETHIDMTRGLKGIAAAAPFLAPYINTLTTSPIMITRTGYKEKDVLSPNTVNFKLGGAVHYKITPRTEAILEGFWGTGNTIYTGSDRYSLKNLKVGQYKLELNNKNWLLRAYTTQEDAGESFNASATMAFFNEAWKPSGGSTGWVSQYAQAYLSSKLQGQTDAAAHTTARAVADVGRPAEGSPEFTKLFNTVRSIPIYKNGGLFVDKTSLYNVEGQYNLTSAINNVAEVLVGGNYKRYLLNSEGTLFADSAGKIGINEYGGYLQVAKQVIERLKITLSGRYDKNQNFKGRFTPRATAVIKLTDNSNFRLSYQTAYRFPSTQQQWIDLQVGGGIRLVGGIPYFVNKYNLGSGTYTYESLQAHAPVLYKPVDFKPETVTSFEAGYKGLLFNGKLLVDLYGYLGRYNDFIYRKVLVQSANNSAIQASDTTNGRKYSVVVNNTEKVKTLGYGIGLDYNLARNYTIGFNLSSDELKDLPTTPGFYSYFNAPKVRINVSFGNSGFGPKKLYGFSVAYKYQDGFYYQGDFASGSIPAAQTLDAQFSFKLPKTRSIVKIGGNNLLNQYYINAIGNARVGGLYYLSFGYNIY